MSDILAHDGPAEDHWPLGLIPTSIEPYLSGHTMISHTLEGVAERTFIDRYQEKKTDRTRSFGIFDMEKPEQSHVAIKFFGFIKFVNMAGYGNWNGSRAAAPKACLRLELEGRGCSDAFNPQVALTDNLRLRTAELMEAEDTGEHSDTLRFQHVLFKKVTSEDNVQPLRIPRGEDPTGKLARVAKEWRLNPRPALYKRNNAGTFLPTPASSFAINDFVQVVAHPELIFRDGRGRYPNRLRVVLAIENVTLFHSHQQLRAMQIPSILERHPIERFTTEFEDEMDDH